MGEGVQRASRDDRDLVAWQKGMKLAKSVYRLTGGFPSGEKFGLVSQMRRAAVSVPCNLAEGQARRTCGEFLQFISHAEGSVAELDTQLTLAVDLGFCSETGASEAHDLVRELRRMLHALRRALSS